MYCSCMWTFLWLWLFSQLMLDVLGTIDWPGMLPGDFFNNRLSMHEYCWQVRAGIKIGLEYWFRLYVFWVPAQVNQTMPVRHCSSLPKGRLSHSQTYSAYLSCLFSMFIPCFLLQIWLKYNIIKPCALHHLCNGTRQRCLTSRAPHKQQDHAVDGAHTPYLWPYLWGWSCPERHWQHRIVNDSSEGRVSLSTRDWWRRWRCAWRVFWNLPVVLKCYRAS